MERGSLKFGLTAGVNKKKEGKGKCCRGEEGSGKKTGSFRGNRFNWYYLAFSRGINNIPSAPVSFLECY